MVSARPSLPHPLEDLGPAPHLGRLLQNFATYAFCSFPCGEAVSYLGIVSSGVCIGSAPSRRGGSLVVRGKTFPLTPLGAVIHLGTAGQPAAALS